MNRTEQNGFDGRAIAEDTPEQVDIGAPPNPDGKPPLVSQKDKLKLSLKNEGRLLFVGAGIVLVLLLMAFHGISRRSLPARKNPSEHVQTQKTAPAEASDSESASMTPILDTGREPEQEVDGSRVSPDQIGRLANQQIQTDRSGNSWRSTPVRQFPNVAATAVSAGIGAVEKRRVSGSFRRDCSSQ